MSDEFAGAQLRGAVLALDPARIGLTRAQVLGPAWAFIMDSSFEDSADWFSLVAIADGSTSLYTSGKFAIIGGGVHEVVRASGAELLRLVNEALGIFAPSESSTLPASGMVTLRALTFDGPLSITAREADFHDQSQPAGEIYAAAHTVISVLRSLPEVGM